MTLKELNKEEKPRERLLKYGVNNLTNEELVSIILRCGTKNISVKEVSTKVLNYFNNIKNLRNANINNLVQIKGIGKVKAITLLASLELGKRVYYEEHKEKYKIKSTKDVFNLLKNEVKYEKKEKFYVILLDSKNNVISYKCLFIGTINRSAVHPREIYKYAIDNLAVSIIVAHNHPSGDPLPSKEDENITNSLNTLGEVIGIKLLDHVIIGEEKYYSFYETNKNKI